MAGGEGHTNSHHLPCRTGVFVCGVASCVSVHIRKGLSAAAADTAKNEGGGLVSAGRAFQYFPSLLVTTPPRLSLGELLIAPCYTPWL